MAETPRRSPAREVTDDLLQRSLTPEQIAARDRRPDLHLRADVPTVEVDETTRAKGVLEKLQGEAGLVALGEQAGISAVVVPIERYLELVGSQLKYDPSIEREGRTATFDIAPTEGAMEASHVEQVRPSDTWL
jgi:hypothetical protein